MPDKSLEMFAPASPFSRPIPAGARALSGMYRQVGVETSVSGATPHELVKLLIDGYFTALNEARGALRNKDIPAKAGALSRAIRIVEEGLRASLDPNGGELSTNLGQLYTYISMRLTHANLKNDDQAIEECMNLMTPIREAWLAIAPQAGAQAQRLNQEVMA